MGKKITGRDFLRKYRNKRFIVRSKRQCYTMLSANVKFRLISSINHELRYNYAFCVNSKLIQYQISQLRSLTTINGVCYQIDSIYDYF